MHKAVPSTPAWAAPHASKRRISAPDLSHIVDLRRQDHRRFAEFLVNRAALLLPTDKALILAVYRDNLAASDVAALLGSPHTPRSVRRRLRALLVRMLSRRFDYVLQASDDWPRTRKLVARCCILQGRTLRNTADHLRISLHTVRREMAIIDALAGEAPQHTVTATA